MIQNVESEIENKYSLRNKLQLKKESNVIQTLNETKYSGQN